MTTQSFLRGLAFLLLGLLMAGCATGNHSANRGTFGEGSCDSGQRVPVAANAAYAIYYDSNGQQLLTIEAEDLTGTQANQMCPTPSATGPGVCPAGFCPRTVAGKTYCLRC